jgi:hypothetical protein
VDQAVQSGKISRSDADTDLRVGRPSRRLSRAGSRMRTGVQVPRMNAIMER